MKLELNKLKMHIDTNKIDTNKIKEILKKADLFGLIKMGAPNDEYDHEARKIQYRLAFKDCDESTVLIIVYSAFIEAFCFGRRNNSDKLDDLKFYNNIEKHIGPLEKYKKIAKEIFESVNQN